MQKRRQTPIYSFRFYFVMEKNQSVLKLYSNTVDNMHEKSQEIETIIQGHRKRWTGFETAIT